MGRVGKVIDLRTIRMYECIVRDGRVFIVVLYVWFICGIQTCISRNTMRSLGTKLSQL